MPSVSLNELHFIWARMRTVAWEPASQIALRNCLEVKGKVSIYVILVKGEYMQSGTYFWEKFLLVTRIGLHQEGF